MLHVATRCPNHTAAQQASTMQAHLPMTPVSATEDRSQLRRLLQPRKGCGHSFRPVALCKM